MNISGAVVLDVPPTRGFTVNAHAPKDITVHGNWSKGFFVKFREAGIELGPYPDPETAVMVADRYVGVFERAT